MSYIVLFNAVSLPGKAAFKGDVILDSEIADGEAENLLEMGAIVAYDDVSVSEVADADVSLTDMTKKQLIQFAQGNGIEINPKQSNDKIIAAIEQNKVEEDILEADIEEDLPQTEDLEDIDD